MRTHARRRSNLLQANELSNLHTHMYTQRWLKLLLSTHIMSSPHLYGSNLNNIMSSGLSPRSAVQAMLATNKEGAMVCKLQSDCGSHTKADAPSLITNRRAIENDHIAGVGLAPCCQWRSHLSKHIVILQLLSRCPSCHQCQ